jgi:hypothetical protein
MIGGQALGAPRTFQPSLRDVIVERGHPSRALKHPATFDDRSATAECRFEWTPKLGWRISHRPFENTPLTILRGQSHRR